IIPGGGGTQRFPRVAGFEAALDVIPSARVFSADQALKFGVIDRIVDGPLDEAAIAFAREILAKGVRPADLPRARNRTAEIEAARAKPEIFAQARETVKRRFRGSQARLRSIDAIENALSMPFEDAFKAEIAIFENCVQTAEHRALSHLFFAEREARRVPDLPKGTAGRTIAEVAIVGGGTMGRGITLAFVAGGLPVPLIGVSAGPRDRALAYCRQELEAGVAKGRISKAEAESSIARLSGGTSLDDVAGADLV